MNQKDGVYTVTLQVLGENGVNLNGDVKDIMTPQLREEITIRIVEMFKSGQIDFKDTPSNREKLNDDSKLMSYVGGLVNNWFRKDKRLNGGSQYQPKNPGSRTGSSDPVIKNLRSLLKTSLTDEQTQRVQEELDKRLSELKKDKEPEVDFSVLPEGLLEDLGIE